MLTREENELLTRVGPGTPAGELLRRYWMPIVMAQELTEESPTKFVRLLGEDLVLFRDKSGRAGLIADHCSHRGASMLYGRVEERGIACAYHGWLYDTAGNCLETPAEPADSKFYLTVKQRAYPVQRLLGLYWAYLGPLPAPVIPKYDAWFSKEGHRRVTFRLLDCNWLQPMENSVDPAHLQILHQDQGTNRQSGEAGSTTRGRTDDVAAFDFYEVPYGIVKRRTYHNGLVDEHPLIFPNILRHQGTQIRVPIDDTHTMHVAISFRGTPDGSPVDDEVDPPAGYGKPFKDPSDGQYPEARYLMDDVAAQDYMAWETQGYVADRSAERLATTDRGVVMLREMLRREIGKVQQGLDPLGVMRDPDHEMIDTGLLRSVREYFGRDRSSDRREEQPVGA